MYKAPEVLTPATLDCVLREVAPGDTQYVPLSEVPSRIAGEKVFRGLFNRQVEGFGPSGSHRRTICLPVGELTTID